MGESADRIIEVLLLDADGVFQRTPPAVWEEIYAFTPRSDKAAFRAAVIDAEHACIYDGREFEVELAKVLREWQCDGDVVGFLALWYTIELDVGVLEIVAELRSKGIRCCTASNQLRGRATHMSAALGLRDQFDSEFYAYALGALKPAPQFYNAIIEALDVEPSRVLFVDDRAENVEAALAVGMNAYHFPEYAGPEALRAALLRHNLGP